MKTSLVLGLLLLGGIPFAAQALALTPSESAGKRLYREGVSESGEPVMARVGAADMLLPATSLPCANCHGADGQGRPEGGVRPPDISWSRLSSRYGQEQINGRNYPAYTEGTLARAIAARSRLSQQPTRPGDAAVRAVDERSAQPHGLPQACGR